jgi:hypothetical protein
MSVFLMVTVTNMEQLENSKETQYAYIDNIDCNTSAVSGAPITIKKWHLKCKGTRLIVKG